MMDNGEWLIRVSQLRHKTNKGIQLIGCREDNGPAHSALQMDPITTDLTRLLGKQFQPLPIHDLQQAPVIFSPLFKV
jgi:hypothetical protein